MKLNLKKVNSKKELEQQGYCRIDFNKGYWDYDWGKYVLVVHYGKNVCFEVGGYFGIISTPVNSIKEALNIYNNGIFKSDVWYV